MEPVCLNMRDFIMELPWEAAMGSGAGLGAGLGGMGAGMESKSAEEGESAWSVEVAWAA